MGEKGIISLTALCIMLILSLMIVGVSNIAARQADITRYYKIENRLQNLADSYFNMTIANMSRDFERYKYMNFDKISEVHSATIKYEQEELEAIVTVYVSKTKEVEKDVIVIMALAELPNYNYGKYAVYKRVLGYISVKKKIDEDNNEEYEFDKFEGYLY